MILLQLERVYFCFSREEEDTVNTNLFCPDSILENFEGLKKAVISMSENFLDCDWEKGEEEREEIYEKRALILAEELKTEIPNWLLYEEFYRENRRKVDLKTLLKSLGLDRFGRKGSIWVRYAFLPKEEIKSPQDLDWYCLVGVNER